MNLQSVKEFKLTKNLDGFIALEGLVTIPKVMNLPEREEWFSLLVWLPQDKHGINEINGYETYIGTYDEFQQLVNKISPVEFDWKNIECKKESIYNLK